MGDKLTRTQQKNLEKFGGVNPADGLLPPSIRRAGWRFALVAGGAVGRACCSATVGGWKESSRRRRCG